MKNLLSTLMLACIFLATSNASAASTIALGGGDVVEHGGRTDSNGCHRDTKAGTRHCH